MKKSIGLFMLLVLILPAFSQDTMHPERAKADYLKKSRSQKTAGRIVEGTGVAMLIAGIATFKFDPIGPRNPNVNNTGSTLLIVGGLCTIVGSTFLYKAAKRNKKSAAELSISNQPIPLLQQQGLVSKMQPTIRLRIPL